MCTDVCTSKNGKIWKKERKIKMKNDYENYVKLNVPNVELADTVLDFIEMRKTIKKPMTERAVKILLNKLPRLSPSTSTQIKILEQSIINNWTDVYPVKDEHSNKYSSFTTVD